MRRTCEQASSCAVVYSMLLRYPQREVHIPSPCKTSLSRRAHSPFPTPHNLNRSSLPHLVPTLCHPCFCACPSSPSSSSPFPPHSRAIRLTNLTNPTNHRHHPIVTTTTPTSPICFTNPRQMSSAPQVRATPPSSCCAERGRGKGRGKRTEKAF